MSGGLNEDKNKNSSCCENSRIFEMDCLETAPFDNEVGVNYKSDHTV
jgi:hypothetical protein